MAKLIFMCGKMAAGKTTLSRERATREDADLLIQDDFLTSLYPGEILDIPDFVRCSSRLRDALSSHICAPLARSVSVVLDFPGNTKKQRVWFRAPFEQADVEHELHFIDGPGDVCKRQLKDRSKHLPTGSHWTTDADFAAITPYLERLRLRSV